MWYYRWDCHVDVMCNRHLSKGNAFGGAPKILLLMSTKSPINRLTGTVRLVVLLRNKLKHSMQTPSGYNNSNKLIDKLLHPADAR